MPPLIDHVAVVTGAGTGIGKAIALALGSQGAALALVGRRPGPLESVAALANEGGREPGFIRRMSLAKARSMIWPRRSSGTSGMLTFSFMAQPSS